MVYGGINLKKYYSFKVIILIFLFIFCAYHKVQGQEIFVTAQNEKITFKDRNLEIAVREVLNKPDGDITKDELKSIKNLTIRYKDITSLDGIQNLTNLENLYLSENRIKDITPLKNLAYLTFLDLESNEIKNISPLGKLKKLETVDLAQNNIKNIKGIGLAQNLKNLTLSYNDIESLDELSSLKNLTILKLNNNNITSVKPLSSLTNLRLLDISYNEISDISSIRSLPILKLTNIDFSWNPLPNYVFEDKLNQEFILRRLFPYINSAIEQYYGEGRQYMDGKILSIEKIDGKIRIKISVTTFVGAHNPPYGIETITLIDEYPGIKIEEFKHEDER